MMCLGESFYRSAQTAGARTVLLVASGKEPAVIAVGYADDLLEIWIWLVIKRMYRGH